MVVVNRVLVFLSVPITSVPSMVTSATESDSTSLINSENLSCSGRSAEAFRTTAQTRRVKTTMSAQKTTFLTTEFVTSAFKLHPLTFNCRLSTLNSFFLRHKLRFELVEHFLEVRLERVVEILLFMNTLRHGRVRRVH